MGVGVGVGGVDRQCEGFILENLTENNRETQREKRSLL